VTRCVAVSAAALTIGISALRGSITAGTPMNVASFNPLCSSQINTSRARGSKFQPRPYPWTVTGRLGILRPSAAHAFPLTDSFRNAASHKIGQSRGVLCHVTSCGPTARAPIHGDRVTASELGALPCTGGTTGAVTPPPAEADLIEPLLTNARRFSA
jgi:hypothetical protein